MAINSQLVAALAASDPRQLSRIEQAAMASSDGRTLDHVRAAFDRLGGEKVQSERLERSGRLFEHVEEPSRDNGGRFVTHYTGDPAAWMAPFMRGPQGCRIDREGAQAAINHATAAAENARLGAPITVRVRPGQTVQVMDAPAPAGGIVNKIKNVFVGETK